MSVCLDEMLREVLACASIYIGEKSYSSRDFYGTITGLVSENVALRRKIKILETELDVMLVKNEEQNKGNRNNG